MALSEDPQARGPVESAFPLGEASVPGKRRAGLLGGTPRAPSVSEPRQPRAGPLGVRLQLGGRCQAGSHGVQGKACRPGSPRRLSVPTAISQLSSLEPSHSAS